MKLITRDTDYALRALCFIAKQDKKVVSVRELVKVLKVPRPFLRRLLQQLAKNRILISSKGQGGGFSLGLPAGSIYLTDLMRIFQGPLKINECFLKKKICPNIKVCRLKKKIDEIEKMVIGELRSINIAGIY